MPPPPQPAAPLPGPLTVRLVRAEERGRWQSLLAEHHYLPGARMVGEALWYVATAGEEWVALLAWAAAALKCRARDAWIGWVPPLQWRRLRFVVNNVRFCCLPPARPNLASRVLALNLRRLSADWVRAYGHPVLLAETFIDPARFRGTCYRAAGWQCLGRTRGFAKQNTRYVAHGTPKTVWVRALRPDAVTALTAPFPPPCPSLAEEEDSGMLDANRLPLEGADGLMDLLQAVPDPRHRRGVRHPVRTVVALAVCAAVAGARSFTAIAQWAQGLSAEALRRLGATRRTPPSEPTIRRVLQSVDADRLDAQLGPWLLRVAAPHGARLSVDGKTVRGGHARGAAAPHLLSAILHQDAVVVAQAAVPPTTNEIPMLPRLLAPLPLAGAVVTADALHTQTETARFLVEEKQADYVFTVKENQATLKQDIATLRLDAFPPAGHHD